MPVWQIDVEKRLATEFFTNVYHVDQASQADAIDAANLIVQQERLLHHVDIIVTKYRIATYPGPSEGTIYAVNLPCSGASGAYLPLFNVLRVDFAVGVGRPSRKYYRIAIAETSQENGEFTNAELTAYQGVIDDLMAFGSSVGLVDVDSQPILSGNVFRQVGMRQLRRGSKRRLQPIIP